jgi:hypothetical protein
MTSAPWLTSTSELAECARAELGGARVSLFLGEAMGYLQENLADQGLAVREPGLQIAERMAGVATRRMVGELVTRGGEATGVRVSARLTAVMNQAGPKALTLSLQFQAEAESPGAFPFLSGEPVAASLDRHLPQRARSGFLFREALTAIATKCDDVQHGNAAVLFCEQLSDRLAP